jgi:anti-sigma B factor antagonist
MDVTVTTFTHCDLIKFSGTLDGNTVDDVKKAVQPVLDAGRYNVVFDLSEVPLISSKGIWLLVDIQKQCQTLKRGELVLACMNPRIQNALKLVAMNDYFRTYDKLIDAIGNA